MEKEQGQTRKSLFMLITGVKGAGKSYLVAKEAHEYAQGNAKKKRGSVMVFCPNNDPDNYYPRPMWRSLAYNVEEEEERRRVRNIRKISINSVRAECKDEHGEIFYAPVKSTYRLFPIKENGQSFDFEEKKTACLDLLNNYKNGLLVLDDIGSYISSNEFANKRFIGKLRTNRQAGLDVIMMVQSVGMITSLLWQVVSVIRIYPEMDNIWKYREKIPDYPLIQISYFIVEKYHKLGKKYFCLTVDLEAKKILPYAKNEIMQEDYELFANVFLETNKSYLSKEIGLLKHTSKLKDAPLKEAAKKAWIEDNRKFVLE